MINDQLPNLFNFDPTVIPIQYQVIKDVRKNFDYDLGRHEIMLSGSVGSSKSILMAHLIVTHCMLWPRARVCLGRRSLGDLKDTIFKEVLDHMEDCLIENKDYSYNRSNPPSLHFRNGSEIICRSWADKNYQKARSIKLSMFVIEEITENSSKEFEGFYKEYCARVGRIPWVKENLVIGATNPEAPSHSAYEYFITKGNLNRKTGITKGSIPTRHVYYSVTTDNPFLPDWYIEQLKETYTKQEIQRMIYGEWIEIKSEVVYYAFEESKSVIPKYEVKLGLPIYITYDFNIGLGKPMSATLFQYHGGVYWFFAEVVVHGSRTEDTLEEMYGQSLLDYDTEYIVTGDASGKHNDTRTKKTDYSIIAKYLSNQNINHKIDVPMSNPPVRTRHIIANGKLQNSFGETHVKITKDCPTLIKGFKLTKLKKGSSYTEDDSDEFQHITTAATYAIYQIHKEENSTSGATVYRPF